MVENIDNSCLWHKRFCHINFDNIVKLSNTFVVRDLPKITKPTNIICKEYILIKQKKVSFPSKQLCTTQKLELVHTDLSGLPTTRGFYGERYFMILVDDLLE